MMPHGYPKQSDPETNGRVPVQGTPSQPQQAQPGPMSGRMPAMSVPQPLQPYPGYQHGYPSYAPSGQPDGSEMQMSPYAPAAEIEPVAPVALRRRFTLLRDVGIGVAIAALVLVGFLMVKLFWLDNDDQPAPTTSTIATVKLELPKGITVELFIDDKKLGSFGTDAPIPVTAGVRHVRLVGPNGAGCEESVKLDAGQTKVLECAMSAPNGSGGSGSSASVPNGSNASVANSKPETTPNDKTVATAKSAVDTPTNSKPSDTKTNSGARATDMKAAKDSPAKLDPKKIDTKSKDAKTDGQKGRLVVVSKPVAKILIDGVDTGRTTPISEKYPLLLGIGKHKVTFAVGPDQSTTFTVFIKPGQTEVLDKNF
jgi:hypothetical protein